MKPCLSLTVRLLQPYYHGRGDGDEPEWPPSPLRLYQALVSAASRRWRETEFRDHAAPALRWLEQLHPPSVVAGVATPSNAKYRLYVSDNIADKIAKSWSGGRDATIADYRTEKDVRPMRLNAEAVHYLYPLDGESCPHLNVLTAAMRSVSHLGWGLDMVVGDAAVLSAQEAIALPGEHWRSADDSGANSLRVPINGTLDALIAKHTSFLSRINRDGRGNESFRPVPPMSTFHVIGYRRATDPIARPYVVFELRADDDSFFSYRHDKLIHIAGMVRHLAIETMKKSPPDGMTKDWVEAYVAGHLKPAGTDHRQLSYLPIPSIGHLHTDPAVRRVMIAAPMGDGHLLRHLAIRLDGQRLEPTQQTRMDQPPTLVRVERDNVARFYTEASQEWASVTPVILPGHDDHKPNKTRKLIETALMQSGIDQPCEYEWSAFSQFPKSLSAHKYDRQKRPTGYIRPDHLLSQTAVHLKLRFANDLEVPGPIVIGAGRHCGFGLMAGVKR